MLRLSALYRFPLKSGKGESLPQARLDKLGLVGDRRWMLVDEASGRFLTQRADPKMSQLSALWNAAGGLTLNAQGFEALDVAVSAPDAGPNACVKLRIFALVIGSYIVAFFYPAGSMRHAASKRALSFSTEIRQG